MVHSSNSFDGFLEKLNRWVDHEFTSSRSAGWPGDAPRGRYSLPDNLQRRAP